MAIERALSIVKPDAAARNASGGIHSRFEADGLKIAAAEMARRPPQEAGLFRAARQAGR